MEFEEDLEFIELEDQFDEAFEVESDIWNTTNHLKELKECIARNYDAPKDALEELQQLTNEVCEWISNITTE